MWHAWKINVYRIYNVSLKARNHLEDLDVHGSVILNCCPEGLQCTILSTPPIIIIIIFINCNWVVTRWQWLFYMYTKHEIGYY